MKKNKLLLAAAALMLGGSVWAQTDVTSTYITNPSFENSAAETASTAQALTSGGTYYGWTLPSLGSSYVDISIGDASNCNGQAFGIPTATNGSFYYFERRGWNSSSTANGTMSTTLSNLPAGAYTLTMDYKGLDSWDDSHKSKGSYLKIEAVASETLGSVTTATFDAVKGNSAGSGKFTGSSNWKSQTLEFSVSNQSNVTLNIIHHLVGGVRTDVAIDNLKLTVIPFATTEDYNAMNDAIRIVEGKTWGFDVDEYTPYNYVLVLDAYAQAKAMDQTANNSQVAVQELTSRMNNATWTTNAEEVNAIWDGSFENDYSGMSGNVQPYGWYRIKGTTGDGYNVRYASTGSFPGVAYTSSDHGLFTKLNAYYGWENGYTMPLNAETYYTVSFVVGGANDCDDLTNNIDIINPSEETTRIKTYEVPNKTANSDATSTSWMTVQQIFKTGDAGNYVLGLVPRNSGNKSQNQFLYGDFVLKTTTLTEATAYYNTVLDEVDDDYDDSANGASEKTAFKNAIDADVSDYTVVQLMEAAANLYTLRDAFVAATPKYDLYFAEKANAERISTDITSGITATTAAEAESAFQAILVGEYNYVKDNFNSNAAVKYGMTIDQWTGTATSGGNTDTPQTNSGEKWGTTATTYYEQGTNGWGSNAWTLNYSITKTLPVGNYVLKIAARASTSVAAQLKATVAGTDYTEALPNFSAEGKGITTTGVASFDDADEFANSDKGYGWQWRYLFFEVTTEGEVTLQIDASANSNQQWCSFGDVALISNVDLTALTSAYNDFTMQTLGFQEDEYAPYTNAALLQAYADAGAILNGTVEPEDQAQVNDLTATLNTSEWVKNTEDMDAIYNGLFATVAEGQNYPDGWTRTNGWGQMQSGLSGDYATAYYNQPGSLQYGNQGIYTMPLAASQAYKLTFSYRSHENNSNNSMTASVLNGEDGLQATTFAGNGSTSEWVEATAFFTTGAAGNYVLTLGNSGNTWVTNVSLVKVTSATLELSDASGYTPTDRTYYETVDLTRTIKADTWSTFCVPFNMENSELDESAEVKELTDATLNGDNYTLTFSDASSIVAGKPYMVRVPSEVTSISLTGKTISSTITSTTKGKVTFTGVYTNGLAPRGSFIISNNYFYNVDSDVTLKAFRGYITVGSGSSVKALNYVFDDDADGISTIENGQLTIDNAPIYNLAGQRIQKMQKGINIVNGKKILR